MLKAADIRSILMAGIRIKVQPGTPETKDYSPCTWWQDDFGTIWSSSPVIGTYDRPDLTASSVAKHLVSMITEGFQLVLEPTNT